MVIPSWEPDTKRAWNKDKWAVGTSYLGLRWIDVHKTSSKISVWPLRTCTLTPIRVSWNAAYKCKLTNRVCQALSHPKATKELLQQKHTSSVTRSARLSIPVVPGTRANGGVQWCGAGPSVRRCSSGILHAKDCSFDNDDLLSLYIYILYIDMYIINVRTIFNLSKGG